MVGQVWALCHPGFTCMRGFGPGFQHLPSLNDAQTKCLEFLRFFGIPAIFGIFKNYADSPYTYSFIPLILSTRTVSFHVYWERDDENAKCVDNCSVLFIHIRVKLIPRIFSNVYVKFNAAYSQYTYIQYVQQHRCTSHVSKTALYNCLFWKGRYHEVFIAFFPTKCLTWTPE